MSLNLASRLMSKGITPRWPQYDQFKQEIMANIQKGYTRLDIWKELKDGGEITCGYDTFCKQIRIWENEPKEDIQELSQFDQVKNNQPNLENTSIRSTSNNTAKIISETNKDQININPPKQAESKSIANHKKFLPDNDIIKPRVSSFRTRTGEPLSPKELY